MKVSEVSSDVFVESWKRGMGVKSYVKDNPLPLKINLGVQFLYVCNKVLSDILG